MQDKNKSFSSSNEPFLPPFASDLPLEEMEDVGEFEFLITSMNEGIYVPNPEPMESVFDTLFSTETMANNDLSHIDKMAIAPFEYQDNDISIVRSITEEDPTQLWDSLSEQVLPIFLGNSLIKKVEQLNKMVRGCLNHQLYGTVLESLEVLLKEGMRLVVLQFYGTHAWEAKLDVNLGLDSKLLSQLVDTWSSFWKLTLPQIEAIFIPLQNEIKNASLVDSVRNLALLTFREKVIFSQIDAIKILVEKISSQLSTHTTHLDSNSFTQLAIFLQMILVLSDLKGKTHTVSFPFSDQTDELAMKKLIEARNALSQVWANHVPIH